MSGVSRISICKKSISIALNYKRFDNMSIAFEAKENEIFTCWQTQKKILKSGKKNSV